jgi:hypothetical protein
MEHPARVIVPVFALAFGTLMAFAIYLQLQIWHVH